MDNDQTDCDLVRITQKLNQNKVKLWLSPFFSDKDGVNANEIEVRKPNRTLAKTYSSQLSIPLDVCVQYLQKLQKKALDNVRDLNNYQTTGVASLKIRVPNEQGSGRIIPVGTELTKTGNDLKELISQEISVPVERLKIIFQGKIMKDEENLESQGVRHGLHIMAIILGNTSDDLAKQESQIQLLNTMKSDVNLLSEDNLDEEYLQVADQTGKSLKLPDNEKKSLILAMTLHEKGRSAIKREDYALALVLLLEAEKEFSFCDSSLLKRVDNYGLLNLDIVWCYLNLQSVKQLPDAQERLRQCEASFHQSYGPDLERLIALKGSAVNESALFMRLHLLQAIVLYHQNKIDESKELLQKVEQELKSLEVDDFQLSQLMELGYASAEARLALRQSRGDINAAVNIIENKRQEKKRNEEAEQKERELKKEKKKLGQCINGEWIEPQFHKALMSMGYSYEVARWALAQSCNNICSGVNLIQEHPEFLPSCSTTITDNMIAQVTELGFEHNVAKLALKKHKGNVEKAVEELVVNNGNVLDFIDSESSSSDSENSLSSRRKHEAYSRVAEGISESEEDHLDISLVAEKAFLQMYKDLVLKR